MKREFRIGVAIIVCVLSFACSRKEGVGGSSSISGVVMTQDVSMTGKPLYEKYVAADKDVYIVYGNGADGDDVKTNTAGVYTFSYLIEGNYTVYCYSDDSLGRTVKVNKTKKVELKGSHAQVDTFVVYKKLDYNDGDNIVVGKVMERRFYNGTTKVRDTVSGQDYDVYIRDITDSAAPSGIVDRVRTAYDGSYIFYKLIPGKYEIYAYGENALIKRNDVFRCSVTVVGHKQSPIAPTLYVPNY